MTGYFDWGFIIYHCDYSDDALIEYCVHASRDSLDSLVAQEEALRTGKSKRETPPVFLAVVRAAQRPARLPGGTLMTLRNDPPAIEGCTDEGVDWAYVAADDWFEFYEELHNDQAWHVLYRRSPGIVKV